MKLVWSQPAVPRSRPQTILPVSLVFIFLGGALAGAGGREAPRVWRASAASLLSTGGLFFMAGALAAVRRRRAISRAHLSLACPLESPTGSQEKPRYGQEDRR
jgi:hypothetical protein